MNSETASILDVGIDVLEEMIAVLERIATALEQKNDSDAVMTDKIVGKNGVEVSLEGREFRASVVDQAIRKAHRPASLDAGRVGVKLGSRVLIAVDADGSLLVRHLGSENSMSQFE